MKANEIEVNDIKFQDPKTLDNGGKMVFISYNGAPLRIQTPKMSLPWSMNIDEYEGSAPKHYINLTLKDLENNPEIGELKKFLEDFDEHLIDAAIDPSHSMSWFKKKKMEKEVAKALYTSQLLYSKDKETGDIDTKWPPRMKAKLPRKNEEYMCDLYDSKKKLIDKAEYKDYLTRGTEVKLILENAGIWLSGKGFGSSWKIKQGRVTSQAMAQGYSFRDSSDDEDDDDNSGDEVAVKSTAHSAFIEESDSDVEISEEDEPTPPPKKRGSKK
tara:strand:+ start:25 stop:837 length:813 start_codon:yes stop_codon:yes gene_type:complete